MGSQALVDSFHAAEGLVVETGPYAGLTMGQVMKDCPDEAYNTTFLRGRGQTAIACRAFLKVLKAHDELAAALQSCDSASVKPPQKPSRNSKTMARAVPVTETLALVPFLGPQGDAHPAAPAVVAKPAPPSVGRQSPSHWWPAWNWGHATFWCLRLLGLVVTLGLPKLIMQIAGLLIRLLVKKTFFALVIVADQAIMEVADAGSMVVTSLEQALGLPVTQLLPGAQQPSHDQVRLAAVAASSVVGSLMNASDDTALIGSAVEAAVTQTLTAQPTGFSMPQQVSSFPGWILMIVGGFIARRMH